MNMKYVSKLISLTICAGSEVHHQRASVLLLGLHIVWSDPALTGTVVLLHSFQSNFLTQRPLSLPGPPPLWPAPDQTLPHLRAPAAPQEAGLRLADPLAPRLRLPPDPSLPTDVYAHPVLHTPHPAPSGGSPGGQAGGLGRGGQ